MNRGLLPPDMYALPEQVAARFGPDVPTLQSEPPDSLDRGRVATAYVKNVAVGDSLPEMPLFLEPDGCVMVPLEATYDTAFELQPRRWRDVLQPPA